MPSEVTESSEITPPDLHCSKETSSNNLAVQGNNTFDDRISTRNQNVICEESNGDSGIIVDPQPNSILARSISEVIILRFY